MSLTADSKLVLIVYRDPRTNKPYLGDQYGRELDGVKTWRVESSMGGRTLTIEIDNPTHLHLDSRQNVYAVRTDPTLPSAKSDLGDDTKIPLGGKKNLVIIRHDPHISDNQMKSYSSYARSLQRKLGKEQQVMLLPEGVDVEVIALHTEDEEEVDLSKRKDAAWNF